MERSMKVKGGQGIALIFPSLKDENNLLFPSSNANYFWFSCPRILFLLGKNAQTRKVGGSTCSASVRAALVPPTRSTSRRFVARFQDVVERVGGIDAAGGQVRGYSRPPYGSQMPSPVFNNIKVLSFEDAMTLFFNGNNQ
jgi:hypothetical protein